MKTVNFTEMKNGTKDEYLLLDEYEQKYIDGTADRCLLYTSPSPRDGLLSRMPSSA